ncbi:IS1182 family transposase [Sedimenticola selenatireducens]|uniref:IS1182 family transposase n=1 Tax=Sedimenticola selenatireducens TaxID=191960 RepID=UPI002AABBC53|nr:IS1182 family transposase [Sedimenticola selenatireducens]
MMGQQPPGQNALLYDFCIEQHVPPNHLLRQIHQVLDLSDLRDHLSSFYSSTGRPSIDPELMIRMLIIGYCYGIRSERRLCEDVHLNLAYRWFCGLGLEDNVPDHSTFSKNRHGRFRDSNIFRFVFESVVQRCMSEGLVAGEGFATDASIVRADASSQNGVPGVEAMEWLGDKQARRPVREYLDALDDENSSGVTPKKVSLSDPQSGWTLPRRGPAIFAYSTNYLIDIENNIIVDVEPTPANRAAEVRSTQKMLDRVERQFGAKPKRLLADTAYGAAPMLEWLVKEKQIDPHIPTWDKSKRTDGTFSSSDFKWNNQADEYTCPAGKTLKSQRRHFKKSRSVICKDNTIRYRASKSDCQACHFKSRCCPNMEIRKIARSIYEDSRDVARAILKTPLYQQSKKDRKKVEVLFAHLKSIMKLDRLRLRGLTGAHDEFVMAALVQNLKKLAKVRYKPPDHGVITPA